MMVTHMAIAQDVQRYKLTIAYRGTRYHGWQRQAVQASYKGEMPPVGEGIPTIQEILSRTLGAVVGHTINLVGSSRTDTGVHAKGQVAHFDTTSTQIPPDGLRRAANARLPDDILIRTIEPAPPTFHAIRSTRCKRYQYAIWNGPDRPVFGPDMVFHRWQPIDLDAMRAGAAALVGEHDFASFAKPGHGRDSTVRTVLACEVSARGHHIVIGVTGTGFLWNMVRIIAGTLVEVGLGRFRAEDVPAMLVARDRRAAGATAPAQGLFLQWVRSTDSEDGEFATDEHR